ncbi:helix-turn-helix transcriptional regulator [Lysinibacillus fusiformis]|uniref:helix-turn-helix transcriptional regulator n=1 Tax=Lysinibacillus fusiformis TaxID=28031 RepID=UPI001C6FC6C4|nr:helix-turn-helix transcriptional regulator [Lysinibacillus fusiformis]
MQTLSIKAARVERGFSQEALAEKLGIGKRTLISWENGEVDVKPVSMFALAYVLNYDIDVLRVPIKKFTNKSHLKCGFEIS